MALTTMSLKEANKIIEIYSNILSHSLELGKFEKFRYSKLRGYDVFDIDNALKVTLAYNAFNTSIIDDIAFGKLKKEAGENTVGVMCFFTSFAPDSIVQQLKKLDPADIYSRSEAYKLEGDFFESELYKAFSKTESQDSFLDYCLSIDKSDSNYWEKVYNRLGITWDDRDEFDEIYFAILNKDMFFKKPASMAIESYVNKGSVNIEEENIDRSNVLQKPSFYNRYKTILDKSFGILFFCLGLLYTPLRVVIFCLFLIIGFIQLYVWLKEPIENKLNFTLNIFYIILCILGIFLKQLGFYFLALIILMWIIEIIVKGLKKKFVQRTETLNQP